MESTNNTNNIPNYGGTGGGSREHKQAFIDRLQVMIVSMDETMRMLTDIDDRISTYIIHVASHCTGEKDVHNIDEVAACCRFLRMARAYRIDVDHIQRLVRLAEKLEWDTKEGYPQRITLTPLQVFMIAGSVGFLVEKEVTSYGETYTEERQLVQEAIWFITRKSAKTAMDALFMLDELLYGDIDAECHVVSNNLDQSLIAYTAFKKLLQRIPGSRQAIKMNQRETRWLDGQKRTAAVYCHTAGATAKDGAKASLVIADEYGSARYVKDKSDMTNAINVYTSSMGTRKNHLWITSTTAGRVVNGPFELYLRGAQQALYRELDYTYDQQAPDDWQFLMAMHPDLWEYSDEMFRLPRMWFKVNPHIGTTVQSTYYDEEWKKAEGNPDYRKEVVTKLFNQFVSDSSRPWLQAEDIRRLQVGHTIRDLSGKDGWRVWVGCDFSKGDDLCSLSYNAYNLRTKQYFFDCDVWIAEEQILSNPNAVLYKQWADLGMLHVSPGTIIDETDVLRKLDEVNSHVPVVMIGYDPYDSMRYVNLFQAWMVGKLRGKSTKVVEATIKQMLVPVSQTWASYNASVQVMWDLVKWPEQKVFVSSNQLIPWCFGNCVLEEDRMGNVKPIKRTENAKVDIAQALLSGIIMQEKMKV